ncbi:MAG: iron ABC transporter permease [Lachnospiraceae bacterium]|nr:iron ABC transporter permease [Lachnospiraceae bacterium]MDD3660316.1 iron ABC transporter permease [Lachnospiraceae bacterium]
MKQDQKQNKKQIRKMHWFLLLTTILILSIFSSALTGSAGLSIGDSFRMFVSEIPILGKWVSIAETQSVYHKIVWEIRMPRIMMAGLTGYGLSVVGVAFQGIFKNPLADPHILGTSSGAALGATLAIMAGSVFPMTGLGLIGASAFLTSMLTVLLVYRIACTGNRLSSVNMILTGTAVSMMLSSFISLMMSLNHDQIEKVYLWTLGSFSAAGWEKVIFLFILILPSSMGILFFAKELDAISTGDETAESLGIDTVRVRKIIILLASLMVAACVSVSGIIGFVGLVVPHVMRLISGPKNKILLPLSGVGGAVFVIFCDTLARNLIAPSELPVGVITALIGAPYFVILLQRNKRKLGNG